MKKQQAASKGKNDLQQGVGRKFRLQFDFEYSGTKGETNNSPSKTVPDMTLTVRQLLENHVKGHNDKVVASEPIFFETEVPVIKDLTDIAAYKISLERRLEEVNEQVKNEHIDGKVKKEKEKLEKNERKDFEKFKESNKVEPIDPNQTSIPVDD